MLELLLGVRGPGDNRGSSGSEIDSGVGLAGGDARPILICSNSLASRV